MSEHVRRDRHGHKREIKGDSMPGAGRYMDQKADKIYIKRNSTSGRFMDVKSTKSGRTLLKSPVKSDTKVSSWKRAFKK